MNTPITVGYTVFNKKHLIPQIVEGVVKCFGPEDEIIFLFDNCTDGSEERAIEEFMGYGRTFTAIHPPNELFEIRANNTILREATNEVIVLFQDDMVCHDENIKDKIFNLMKLYGDNLGLMGGRDGFEIREPTFPEKPVNKVSSWVHKRTDNDNILDKDAFAERTILNRGPLVFRKELIEKVGYLDESFWPLWGDDMEYCARCAVMDLTNVVFQCDIESNISWGATRKGSKLKRQLPTIMKRNWEKLMDRWGAFLMST